jgi:hypothetical protein
LDEGEPDKAGEEQERDAQEEEELDILSVLLRVFCVSIAIWHTSRHGNSNGAFPPGFDTGKKGAMPEPGGGQGLAEEST